MPPIDIVIGRQLGKEIRQPIACRFAALYKHIQVQRLSMTSIKHTSTHHLFAAILFVRILKVQMAALMCCYFHRVVYMYNYVVVLVK